MLPDTLRAVNSAPWWFVLVTALVTGGFTLAGAWLTGRTNLKRHQEELSHQRVLEREKRLYDRRIELYAEVIPVAHEIASNLFSLCRHLKEPGSRVPEAFASVDELIEPDIQKLRTALHLAAVLSSSKVGSLIEKFIGDVEATLDMLRNEQFDGIFEVRGNAIGMIVGGTVGEMVKEIRIEVGAGRRQDYVDEDQGVTRQRQVADTLGDLKTRT